MTSVPHSLRDLFAGNRTDVGCLVRAYVRLWLFDRWLGQIWRHSGGMSGGNSGSLGFGIGVVGIQTSSLMAQPMLGCVCSTSREVWRDRLVP